MTASVTSLLLAHHLHYPTVLCPSCASLRADLARARQGWGAAEDREARQRQEIAHLEAELRKART